MKIQDEKVVSLTYTLVVDGKVEDQATEENPLEYIHGLGYLLPKFEEYLSGKTVGDSFEFVLSPEEGYGVYDAQAVVELPKHIFEIDGKIQEQLLVVGQVIPMMNQAGGVIPGKVIEVRKREDGFQPRVGRQGTAFQRQSDRCPRRDGKRADRRTPRRAGCPVQPRLLIVWRRLRQLECRPGRWR